MARRVSPGAGARASAALAAPASKGLCTMTAGLTEAELRAVEARFEFRFNDDHREFLAAGLPTGPSWPDWRNGDEMTLRAHLGLPARHILIEVQTEGLWRHTWGERPARGGERNVSAKLAAAPRMVPLYGYGFTAADPSDGAVWWIEGGQARRAANDLEDFVRLQQGQPVSVDVPADRLPFWDDFAEDPEVVTAKLPDLPVPPFPADPVPSSAPTAQPPRDPGRAFADLGVDLPELTRHDDVLAHRAPMWTVPVVPGMGAAKSWEAVRHHFPTTGLWPVLITERMWHRVGDDGISDREPVLAAQLDGAAWLSAEYARRTAGGAPLPRGWEPWTPSRAHWIVEWSRTYDVERYDRLALIPTPAPWLVPGLLQWSGAVNYDVLGLEHASVLRRWAGRWGAELLALDDETASLRMSSPPTLDGPAPDALEAAVEAYLYCPDAIDVNPDGVDALAPLLTGPVWTFWWD